jgi:hypothetical protein
MTAREDTRTLSLAELETEIARTRARLSQTLAALDREYALRHLFVRSTRLVREGRLEPGVIAKMAQREILPLAVIGAGLAWLALGRTESGDLLRRLSDGLGHALSIARQLLALSSSHPAAPPPVLDAPERGGETVPAAHRDA